MDNKEISKIFKLIESKHNKFINSLKNIPYEISDSDNYMVYDSIAKLSFLCKMMVDARIIDNYEYKVNGSFAIFRISKNGLINFIELISNGEYLIMSCGAEKNKIDNLFSEKYKIKINMKDSNGSWDLEGLSNSIVDFIHENIYRKSKCDNFKIKSFFNDIELNND